VSTIEGRPVKALVAFFDVQPSCCGDAEHSFQDEVAFQQIFVSVAELCGLAATGYALPDISTFVAAPDDDSDDDGEDA
jgi:hypothetical protein